MNHNMDQNEIYVAIATQRALLGNVTPNLRAVTIKIDSEAKLLSVYFFYNNEISDKVFDIASTAITELSADFSEFELDDHIEILPYPQEIPVQGRLVFLRDESQLEKHCSQF